MTRSKILPKTFFIRDAHDVARELLGKYLVRRSEEETIAYQITEVEVYDGFDDKASHAAKGKTRRNEIMFDDGGNWYVYLIYGMYEMLNIVTREKGYPSAILIRAVEGMNGPGKLTRALGITRELHKKPARRSSGLWIEDRGVDVSSARIERLPRIGVAYAGPVWAKKKWRYVLRSTKR